MLWRASAAAVVTVVSALLLLAPAALAGGPPDHQGFNNGNHGQGRGKDPCTKPHVPAYCQQAPEAPAGLVYPAAAGAALTLFACLERRRRRSDIRHG
jgi:hypothetical protein